MFGLFGRNKKIEQMHQELSNQMQTMQNAIVEEIRRLGQQLSGGWTAEQAEQTQKQIADLSRKLRPLIPEPFPASEKNLNELHKLDVQKALLANNAIVDYGSSHETIEKTFSVAQQKRYDARELLHASVMKLFPSDERDTDKLAALNTEDEREDNPPETAS
jgi:hypothetical protein